MSKGVKSIVSIALPIAGSIFGGPIGGAIGGALGGAMNGGGIKGAVLGGLTGYMGAGAVNGAVGNAAGSTLAKVTGNAALQGPTMGSGILGAVTGGGLRALGNTVTQAATSIASDPSKLFLGIGNQLMAQEGANTARDAAKTQAAAIDRGIATQQPYTQLGADAAAQIKTIQADPAGYIKNNEFYGTLADDAERRLTANQAAKGKLASGGTQAALQDQLLSLGSGLVNQDINRLQTQVNTGAGAATGVSNMQAAQGDVNAAGQVGSYNAINTGYQNQINTLLAMQGLNKTPTYAPTLNL